MNDRVGRQRALVPVHQRSPDLFLRELNGDSLDANCGVTKESVEVMESVLVLLGPTHKNSVFFFFQKRAIELQAAVVPPGGGIEKPTLV